MSYRISFVPLLFCFAAAVCSAAQLNSPGAESTEQDQVSSEIIAGTASSATVSVAELAVPAKARKELEKAKKAVLRKRLEEADHYISKALLAWPHYCQALTLKSWLALTRNSYEQARVDAEMAVQYDPNDYLAQVALGDSYMFLNRLDDAVRAIDRSIAIKPNAWQGYYAKGKLSIERGDWSGALRAAEKASTLTQEKAYLHLLRVFAFAGMKDWPAADNEMAIFQRMEPEASRSPQLRRALNVMGMHNIEPPVGVSRDDTITAVHP